MGKIRMPIDTILSHCSEGWHICFSLRSIIVAEIIVAVDGYSYEEAEIHQIFAELSAAHSRKLIWGIKISDMLYSGDVPAILQSIKKTYGLNVMADVKLHDIPSTMEHSLTRLVDGGSDIVSVHCSSNYRPIREDLHIHIAGVTLPSSFTNLEMKWTYGRESADIMRDFADLARMNTYEYLIGSVQNLKIIDDTPLKRICTGIRPHWYAERHDQAKVDSVKEAVRQGADLIVVGRPIIQSPDIVEAIQKIYDELD
jgi:orotidine-5'-phosphate decarboxylase